MQVHVSQLLNHSQAVHCPNLTELELILDKDEDEESHQLHKSLERALSSINAPEVLRLQLSSDSVYESSDDSKVCMGKLIPTLAKQFPKLQFLQELIHPSGIREGVQKSSVRMESLTFLQIRDSAHLTYDFLQMFPKLRTLDLETLETSGPESQIVTVLDHSPSPWNPKVSIREQIQTGQLYKSNVWELFPELEKIWVNTWNENDDWRFDRETYFQLKAEKKAEFKAEEFKPLRNDIWKRLQRPNHEFLDPDSSDDGSYYDDGEEEDEGGVELGQLDEEALRVVLAGAMVI